MEVFTNGIRAGIPPSYPFCAVITYRIVRQREGEVNCHNVCEVDEAVHLIVNSIKYWNLEMVASVNLRGHEHGPIFNFWPFL